MLLMSDIPFLIDSTEKGRYIARFKRILVIVTVSGRLSTNLSSYFQSSNGLALGISVSGQCLIVAELSLVAITRLGDAKRTAR